MAKGAIKIRDRGWNKLVAEFRNIGRRGGLVASVGIQGDEANEDRENGLTNADIALFHEYGTEHIPERSFLRSTFDENEKAYNQDLVNIARGFYVGETVRGGLLLLGEKFRSDILKRIKKSIPPPLKEATIKRKYGETTPLIDTGQLWNSITAEIQDLAAIERD